jgi:hypothetical protein
MRLGFRLVFITFLVGLEVSLTGPSSSLFAQDAASRSQDAAIRSQDAASRPQDSIPPLPDPTLVTRRAALLPGWGQWTNRAYWKIPVVWGGLGWMAYQTSRTSDLYLDYRNAYRWRTDNDPLTRDPFESTDSEASLLQKRDLLRRSRDAYVLLTLVAYGLQILDAHVDAHLKGFERLDFSVRPALPGQAPIGGGGAALTWTYRF